MKPLNILIVDDSATMRQFVRRAVQLSDIPVGEVHEAANGKEALAIIDAHDVDALFTDLNMPVMSGPELLRELDRQGRQMPIRIVVSTDGSDARREEMKGLARWYVNKPVRPEVVRDLLSELASHLPTNRGALDRALAVVAEESFFTLVDPVPDDLAPPEGHLVTARVMFEGGFAGALSCTMPRALAHELTAAFSGTRPEEIAVADPAVDDLAGEFANMVCGRWLTDVAPQQLFSLTHPSVEPAIVPGAGAPCGMLNGQPIWLELTLEG
jgi:two-component system chemotaxis response regulator CheY